MSPRSHTAWLIVSTVLLLAACSGGGGGSPTPTAPLGPTAAQVEFDSYGLVNEARENNQVDPPLELREAIANVAREHSEAMRDEDYFGHQDGQGRTVAGRLQDKGIPFDVAAENLAMVTNVGNPAAWAHEQLMNSADHRPNILDPRVGLIGVGVASDGNTYWITQVFVGR